MTGTTHTGSCLCGKVRYAFEGDPLLVAVCHCRHCQRQSGSAFSLVLAVSDAAYTQQGETRVFADKGESGQAVLRHFCENCGSPIVSIAEAIPGLTLIKGGSLDNPGRWTPSLEAFCESSLPWIPAVASERHARSNIGE
ncbi:GFA family protein [Sphingobium yanoikuyae]|uniref:Aldehyde-activating protein n=1 Tax=Sphingobium yanoikuyae TaxID=13690 RepID=A0A291N080_SPHYA|nr:GFA family protein [Sphingobium yanoikuyae]ATI80615.1 aldehyde-activating protein [Sphingobium yanoikuyae]